MANWTPRILKYLALIRKAVPIEIFNWKDRHEIYARWTKAGPMPHAYRLQINLLGNCLESPSHTPNLSDAFEKSTGVTR